MIENDILKISQNNRQGKCITSFINKDNKLILSRYTADAKQQKFQYLITDLIQSATRHLYRKQATENEDIIYAYKSIKYGEELSTTEGISVKLFEIDYRDIWRITIDYSIDDFYKDFSEFNKKMRLTRLALKETIEKVNSNDVYILDQEKEEFISTKWFTIHGSYRDDEFYKKVTLEIDPYVAECIMTNNNYTRLQINSLINLGTVYELRIYELVKKWYGNLNSFVYDVQLLRLILDIVDKYTNFNNFNRLLQDSIDNINEKTELKIGMRIAKKKGKKVTAVEIYKLSEKSIEGEVIEEPLSKEKENFIKYLEKISSRKVTKLKYDELFNSYGKLISNNLFENAYNEAIKRTLNYYETNKGTILKSITVKQYNYFKKELAGLVQEINFDEGVEINVENKEKESNNTDENLANNGYLSSEYEEVVSEKDFKETFIKNTELEILKYISEVKYNTYIKRELINSDIDRDKRRLIIKVPNEFTKSVYERELNAIIFESIAKKYGEYEIIIEVERSIL